MDLTEFRRSIGDLLQNIFPDYRVLYTRDVLRYERVELPLVTYYLDVRAATNERPTWYETEKDMDSMTGSVSEKIPCNLTLRVGLHSLEITENEAMEASLLRAWGRAPALLGVGFRLEEGPVKFPADEWGVYATYYTWIGWAYLEGPTETAPLIREIRGQFSIHGVVTEESLLDESWELKETP